MDAIGPIGLDYQQMCERIEAEFFKALSMSSESDTEQALDLESETPLNDEILDAGQITSAAVFNAPSLEKFKA